MGADGLTLSQFGEVFLYQKTKGKVIGEFKNFELIGNFLTEVSLKRKGRPESPLSLESIV